MAQTLKVALRGLLLEGPAVYIFPIVNWKMGRSVHVLLWLSLLLSFAFGSAIASQESKSPSQQPPPLTRAAELGHTVADLEDPDSRREGLITSILRRYRDITSQFQAMNGMVGSSRDSNSASPFSDAALTRIRDAVSSANDELRQLNELNDQARQLEKKLAKK
jgi:hypothetical protein